MNLLAARGTPCEQENHARQDALPRAALEASSVHGALREPEIDELPCRAGQIGEFQKALRSPTNRVPTYEALGLCFIEKEQYPMAATILARALSEPGMSESHLIGVLYLLGRCAEQRGQRSAAIEYYQRVFVVDIQFRDVSERLAAVEGATT